jgi:S-adenosylmethionine-diacylglycerol 3-amino-3-carboxypropyl transferase
MSFLFDFGVSQEDPLTEQFVLNIQPSDHILSVASGGEVPLSLISLHEKLRVTAVDISNSQISLCRIKLQAALHLDFPENGQFLGFDSMKPARRKEIYMELIRPELCDEDKRFWDENMGCVASGVIHAGRFEQYIAKMRFFSNLFIGKQNLQRLIDCHTLEEQRTVFRRYIASRKSLQLLFKIAFHPAIYKKRGLQEQALQHADKSTGEQFYAKFENFCTANLASNNYFLQFFLTGRCQTPAGFPDYLKSQNKQRLISHAGRLNFKTASFEQTLCECSKGDFTKIHLSNLGDWMSEEEFSKLVYMLDQKCAPGTLLCYRYLQKDHFAKPGFYPFSVDEVKTVQAQLTDRFPFYTIYGLELP